MIGPATNTRVELGLNAKSLNAKSLNASERLQELPAGQMCNYKVKLTGTSEVDNALIAGIKSAYDAAG